MRRRKWKPEKKAEVAPDTAKSRVLRRKDGTKVIVRGTAWGPAMIEGRAIYN